MGAYASGTTNWSVLANGLQPGIYNLVVTDADGADNFGTLVSQQMTISAVVVNGNGSVTVTNATNHAALGNGIGANLLAGTTYVLAAQPNSGWLFANWTYGTSNSLNPIITNQMAATTVYTANFTLAPRPSVGAIQLSGTNLVLANINAQTSGTYYVLMTTNIALPTSQWTPVATNVLSISANATITVTNGVTRSSPQHFYILKTQ